MTHLAAEEKWDLEINPSSSLWRLNLKELWKYKDLLFLFVKRDITTVYKQTLLGPFWFFVQPILTSLTFLLIFGKIANLSTDTIPQPLFYLSGIVVWNYFSVCVTASSNTFIANASIFGKVYFPRLVNPLSITISNMIKFFIQMIPMLGLWIYYMLQGQVAPNIYIGLFPLLIIQIALLSLGTGLVISSLTTKYRDLSFLVSFGLQLLMYSSSVIYPLSQIPDKYRMFIQVNPMSWIIETFRYGFMGSGLLDLQGIIYSWVVTIVLLFTGILLFNKVERNFMDTV